VSVISLRLLWKRALHLSLLVIVGFLVAFVVVTYGDASWGPAGRWFGLVIYTAIIFGGVIRDFRRSWGQLTFWLSVTGLFAIHSASYAAVLTLVEGWRSVWFLLISIGEYPILVLILHALGYDDRPIPPERNVRRV
jgi:hypothetical protein